MEKLTKDSPETRSLDVVAENIAQLKALFPEATTEGRIDFEVLKQLLGSEVEERVERYGLNWHGKRQSRQLALSPSSGTLRPSMDDSLSWETTSNLLIEGDNLEVLKLLQKSYANKINFIYIDPPYNTGKDFVYPDDFSNNIKNYLEITKQTDGINKLTSNFESTGRFHTDWLNMIYPRMRLARQLMSDNGLMYISINDKEVHHLRSICDELFGEENFVECYIWNSTFRPDNSSKIYRKNAEFVLCYAKRIESIKELVGERIERTGLPSLTKASMAKSTLLFPAGSVNFTLQDGYYKKGVKDSYELLDDVNVVDGKNIDEFRLTGNVIWGQDNLIREISSGTKIIIKTDSFVPYVDKGAQGTLRPAKIISNEIVGDVLAANAEIRELLGDNPFNYPKPISLIKYLICLRPENELILDFFAGSGTTAHAVMAANTDDGGNRKFILVQLPEFLDKKNQDQEYAAKFCEKHNKKTYLTELTKMRIRKACEHYANGLSSSRSDFGFRVFRLDASNIRPWEAQGDNLPQTLMDAVEHIKEGRTEQDLLFELLLKLGLDLTVPMEQKPIAGKTVHSIGAGVLMVCLDEAIAKADYEALGNGIVAWHRELAPTGETTLVFRDSAFADDVVKTNLTAILEQYGIPKKRIRSL